MHRPLRADGTFGCRRAEAEGTAKRAAESETDRPEAARLFSLFLCFSISLSLSPHSAWEAEMAAIVTMSLTSEWKETMLTGDFRPMMRGPMTSPLLMWVTSL